MRASRQIVTARKKTGFEFYVEELRAANSVKFTPRNTIRSDNKTGVIGVSICPKSGKFIAKIRVNGKQYPLGLFASLNDAADVRKKAEVMAIEAQRHFRRERERRRAMK